MNSLPKQSTTYLKSWLLEHSDFPYPSKEEMETIVEETGLTFKQVKNWFTNTRKVRI